MHLYQTITETDEKGRTRQRVVYTGSYYNLEAKGMSRNNWIKAVSLVYVLMIAFFLTAGWVDFPALRQIYAAIPYACIACGLMYGIMGISVLFFNLTTLTENLQGKATKRIKRSGIMIPIFVSLAFAGTVVSAIINRGTPTEGGFFASDIFCGILLGCLFGLAILYHYFTSKLKFSQNTAEK